jgi:hypothetical protein
MSCGFVSFFFFFQIQNLGEREFDKMFGEIRISIKWGPEGDMYGTYYCLFGGHVAGV